MTRDEILALLERHQAAFARRDPVALATDHAVDGTLDSPAHGRVYGREAIEEIYRYWFTAFPDLTFTWVDPLVDGDRASFWWRFTGTATGPFFGVVPAGTRVEMNGAAEYRFGSGAILSVKHVFDFSGVLMKTGVLKIKPS